MFISITFRGTIIDETNKTQQKVRGSKFTFKMSTIHANTCIQTNMLLRNRCCDDGVAMQLPLPQQIDVLSTFNVLSTHIMDHAVVHRIQIWRIRWPHLWRDKLWRLSLQHGDSVTCTMCLCPILLKSVVIPENRADIQQKHILAELYSGNSHRWP